MGNSLPSLRKLEVHLCRAFAHLPPSFSGLSSLESLSILQAETNRGELLAGPGCLTSLEGLGCVRRLKELSLSSMPHLSSLPASICGLSALTSLEVANCPKIKHLPEEIGRLELLEKVRISQMDGLKRLPRSLHELRRVRVLEVLACCGLTSLLWDEGLGNTLGGGSSSSSISSNVNGPTMGVSSTLLPSLQSLKMKELMLESFPPPVYRLTSLTTPKLVKMNRLLSLPDSISQLSQLQALQISHSGKFEALPETLGSLSRLTTLQLIGLESLQELPESLGQLKMLRTLDIIDCPMIMRLPESFPDLPKLQSCSLVKLGISSIPDDFWKLSSLLELAIKGLGNLGSVPESFTQLPRLQLLETSSCTALDLIFTSLKKMPTLWEWSISASDMLSERQARAIARRGGDSLGDEGEEEEADDSRYEYEEIVYENGWEERDREEEWGGWEEREEDVE
ncbi:hypothetical protein CLOP_g5623 [Closterium sp. NIES-67]|nr:hypothetical protein CLOP_g5623 [Closterium sp. NIES-67]